jgi:hypothetical protein
LIACMFEFSLLDCVRVFHQIPQYFGFTAIFGIDCFTRTARLSAVKTWFDLLQSFYVHLLRRHVNPGPVLESMCFLRTGWGALERI